MRRRCICDSVMIEHDDVDAKLPRAFYGLMVLAAAVDSHNQARSGRRQVFDPGLAEPIPLSTPRQADRNRLRPAARRAQSKRQKRRGRNAISVVVAENADRLPPTERSRDALCGLAHTWQQMRVRRGPFICIEEVSGFCGISQPARQDGMQEWITVELWQAIAQWDWLDPNRGRVGPTTCGALWQYFAYVRHLVAPEYNARGRGSGVYGCMLCLGTVSGGDNGKRAARARRTSACVDSSTGRLDRCYLGVGSAAHSNQCISTGLVRPT